MKKTGTFIIAFLWVVLSFSLARADDFSDSSFVPGFEDVPLLEGMSPAEDGSMSFDSPEGRFIQVYMSAPQESTKKQIIKFYDESLPPLGWIREKSRNTTCYTREDESLCIDITGNKPPLAVRFELKTVIK